MAQFFQWGLLMNKNYLLVFSFINGFCLDFINACIENDVRLYDVCYENDVLVAKCNPKDYAQIRHISKLAGGRTKIKYRKGFVFSLLKLFDRKGIMVGALIAVLVVNFLCGFVWKIDISGNEKLTTDEIKSFLVSQGFYEGVYWKSIDKNAVEDMMMSSYEDVAWVHINRFGTKAKVELHESTVKPKITDKTITNLKATKDGIIVSAKVQDGWQVINVGDSVVAGDILVSGVYESEINKINLYAHGSGEYLAQVVEPFKLIVNRQQSYKSVISKKDYKTFLFFGLKIPLYIGKIPNKNVDIVENTTYLKINSNAVPIGVNKKEASVYEKYTKNLSDKQLYNLTNNQVKKEISSKYDEKAIISKNISISLTPNSAVAKGNITLVENIGEEQPIISK